MFYSVLGFLIGILVAVLLPALPSLWVGGCLLCLGLLTALIFLIRKTSPSQKMGLLFLAVMLGFGWSVYRAERILAWTLPRHLENKEIMILGVVNNLPEVFQTRTTFTINLLEIESQPVEKTPKIKLTWQSAPPLQPGDRWRFRVRLKRPHGQMNPGGFDQEKYLFFQKIRATGQVRKDQKNARLEGNPWAYPVHSLRFWLRNQILLALPRHPLAGFITALTIGDGSGIAREEWEVLRKTGITHLMVISGSHITLLAGFAFFLGQFFWRRMGSAPLWLSAPQAGAIFGLVTSVFYSLLAGFSIPTQRACVVVACYFLCVLFKKHTTSSLLLWMALLAVLVWDPFAVMAPGFWLSFIAVGLIFYGMHQRVNPTGLLWRVGRIHVLMAIGLLPLTAYFFHQISLVGTLVNLFAVPWVSFLVTPLALSGVLFLPLFGPIAVTLLSLTHTSLDAMWRAVLWLSQLPFAELPMPTIHPAALILAILGALLLFAPRGIYGRYLGLFCLLPLWLFPQEKPKWGEVWFTILDVGQGLSVVVETSRHALVYDAGAKYGGFNAAKQIVRPYLHTQGVRALDVLMISHLDNDHLGDAALLAKTFQAKQVLTSDPDRIPWADAHLCNPTQKWEWDGVSFALRHPDRFYAKRNNRSCVLQISVGNQAVLLPGDIESSMERVLLERYGKDLDVDILVAPHHGSLTSSSPDFIAVTSPQYVVFSAGVPNRYGLPKPRVVERYQRAGAAYYTTGETGAISFRLSKNKPLQKPIAYRLANPHWWHTPAVGN